MTERTYSSDEYRILADLCEHEWASIAAAKTAPAKLAAALRIAARVMEPGVIEKAYWLAPTDAGSGDSASALEVAHAIRSALTRTPHDQ